MVVDLRAEPPFQDVLVVAENMRPRDRDEIFATRWDDAPERVAQDVVNTGAFRWGAYLNGDPVAMLGVHPRWPNVWTAWAFATPEWRKVVIPVTRHVRHFILPALFNAGAHRVDCLALETHKDARKWLTYLGATPEKSLDKWGKSGETFVSYVWTREHTKRIIDKMGLIHENQ